MQQVVAILDELKGMGTLPILNVLRNHGAPEECYGVKVGDMKKIQKRIKKDYELSKALYKTGVSDAMYLAGLIADEAKMTEEDLQFWADNASWHMISEYTVPWIAAESRYGWELGLKWIESPKPLIASTGWSALSNVMSLKKDEELDIPKLKALLKRVVKEIHKAPNRVKYTMNSFVIAAGSFVAGLTEEAEKAGKAIGDVEVEMGGTSCKVPYAPDYIDKVRKKGYIGKKKKMARC